MTREPRLKATIEILVDVFGTPEEYLHDAEFHAKVEEAAQRVDAALNDGGGR